jgi:putative two-component system response regulator
LLAMRCRQSSRLAEQIDAPFLKTLEGCALLHDIGNAAMPDHILARTGRFDSEDVIIMQAHTTIGAEILQAAAKRDRGAAAFWQMAVDIARHHHEHFDGRGYPDQLTGNNIPLAARIVAIADAYDTLRIPGALDIALSHNAAVQMIVEGPRGRFDPLVLQAFKEEEAEFDAVFRNCPDSDGGGLSSSASAPGRSAASSGLIGAPTASAVT